MWTVPAHCLSNGISADAGQPQVRGGNVSPEYTPQGSIPPFFVMTIKQQSVHDLCGTMNDVFPAHEADGKNGEVAKSFQKHVRSTICRNTW